MICTVWQVKQVEYQIGVSENMMSDRMSNTEKDSFENLKRLIFNCTPIIEKMILKIEIELFGDAIKIINT